ncbi:hypothetical protein [Nocardia sp. NPDC059239]|uniref:hypothetical protein n=1 Tax=unclassified Nocardia TaxID=2637762 RepID=UPI0036B4EDBB
MTEGLEATPSHPCDYYYRPGLPLRPPPPRAVSSELWFEPRKAMLGPWIDVRPEPADTPPRHLRRSRPLPGLIP